MPPVITSFACKHTQLLFETGKATGFLKIIAKSAKRKLTMLHMATTLDDLRVPPGNRLEPLFGTLLGKHSIRVNDQYRLCFQFKDGSAEKVEIIDYHR